MSISLPFPCLAERRALVGVVHLRALPGAPEYTGSMQAVLDAAAQDAQTLRAGGADGVIIENFGDQPFFGARVGQETVAAMTRCAMAVAEVWGAPETLGINVLRNDAAAALGIASATGAGYMRINVHTGSAATDQGILKGEAARTLRKRIRLAPACRILADVHVKHASPMGTESLEQAALDTFHRGMADGLILSGAGTGSAPEEEHPARVRAVLPEAPLWLGSGVTFDNVERLAAQIDGVIVATSLKPGGDWRAPIELERVKALAGRIAGMGPAPFQSGGL